MEVFKVTQQSCLSSASSINIKTEEEDEGNPDFIKTQCEEGYCFKAEGRDCLPVSPNDIQVKLELDAELQVKPELLSNISLKTESQTWDFIKPEEVTHQRDVCITDESADVHSETVECNAEAEGSTELWVTEGARVKIYDRFLTEEARHVLQHAGDASGVTQASHKSQPQLNAKCGRIVQMQFESKQLQERYPQLRNGRKFCLNSPLTNHQRSHKAAKRKRNTTSVCETCGKSFTRPETLRSHMRTHTGERPYACETCGRCFARTCNLKSHLRTHTGEKPYVCEKCDKTYSQQSNLKIHLRTHTGEKPYVCEKCGKSFVRACHLQCHTRTHSGKKPYACDRCGKSFSVQCNLKAHLRAHTERKPYACGICEKKFSQMCNLKSHVQTHNATETVCM